MKKYGLIGKDISYSLSPLIHNYLIEKYNIDAKYELIDLKEIDGFKFNDYEGLNVTTPFKIEVLKYVKNKSGLNSINTIINKNAYNTDIMALDYFVKRKIKDIKVVGILGNSATANMIKDYFKENIKIEVLIFSRTDGISYDDIEKYNIDFLINTTPLGQGKYIKESPIDKKTLKKLNPKYILDYNYNPLNTEFIKYGKELGIKNFSGLELLIRQAMYSFNLFFDIKLSEEDYNELYVRCVLSLTDKIILYGMPFSGKSFIYKTLSLETVKDLDFEIEKALNTSIYDYIKKNGEEAFRQKEREFAQEILNKDCDVLIVGGGFFTNTNNFENINKYCLIHLKLTYKELEKNYLNSLEERPLIGNKKDLESIYNKRITKYDNIANLEFDKTEDIINLINNLL